MGLEAGRIPVDKNPMHALHLDFLPRVFPEAPVIFSLRHPYDAALSCYMQDFAPNAATQYFLSLEPTAALCARMLRMLIAFREARPGRVCELRYEDLVRDFEPEIARVLAAVGLEWDDAVTRYATSAVGSGVITTPSYEQVTQPLYDRSIDRWHRYREWLAAFTETLGPEVEEIGYGASEH